ncbi:MAG: radical SAM family heme chaperone HemW, partial [Crocinitomicaceae bacterium]|nr:radical SAM family heme chaperone HemW [Crocinitomicaceae bacterium]
IIKEIESRKHQLTSEIKTIYFGGGTPSLLSGDELKLIIESVYQNYNVANNIELTLECNPDDLTQQKLQELKGSGVNRLSIGVQSFDNEELKFFNRAHNANEAEGSIKRSQDVGFENITIDLIYGSSILTDKIWLDNLQKVADFEVPHLSAYGLTIEPKTKLAHQVEMGKLPRLNDDKMIDQFKTLIKKTKEFGFTQYEVSSFGKKGFYSQHNSNYWKGVEYLGFGPSAHSFIENKRLWNIANNIKYINAISKNEKCFEEEIIDEKTAFNEYVLTRLRTIWGVDIDYISNQFNEELNSHFKKEIQPYLNSSYLQTEKNKITLTQEGIFIADKITSDLFYV